MKKVLIVEDEAIVAMDIRCKIQSMGFEPVGVVPDYIRAITVLLNNRPDLVIIDIGLKGPHSGVDLALMLNQKFKIPFIFITGHFDDETLNKCYSTYPLGCLPKPFHTDDLFRMLDGAFRKIEADNIISEINFDLIQRIGYENYGIMVFNTDTCILSLNSNIEKISGIPNNDAIGMSVWDIISPENLIQTKMSLHKLVQKGEVEFEIQICAPKDVLITVSVVAFTLQSREFKQPFYIAFIKQIENVDLIKQKRPKVLNFEIKDVLCKLGNRYIIKALEIAKG